MTAALYRSRHSTSWGANKTPLRKFTGLWFSLVLGPPRSCLVRSFHSLPPGLRPALGPHSHRLVYSRAAGSSSCALFFCPVSWLLSNRRRRSAISTVFPSHPLPVRISCASQPQSSTTTGLLPSSYREQISYHKR